MFRTPFNAFFTRKFLSDIQLVVILKEAEMSEIFFILFISEAKD